MNKTIPLQILTWQKVKEEAHICWFIGRLDTRETKLSQVKKKKKDVDVSQNVNDLGCKLTKVVTWEMFTL